MGSGFGQKGHPRPPCLNPVVGLRTTVRPQRNPSCGRSLPAAAPIATHFTDASLFKTPQLQCRISTSLADVTRRVGHGCPLCWFMRNLHCSAILALKSQEIRGISANIS